MTDAQIRVMEYAEALGWSTVHVDGTSFGPGVHAWRAAVVRASPRVLDRLLRELDAQPAPSRSPWGAMARREMAGAALERRQHATPAAITTAHDPHDARADEPRGGAVAPSPHMADEPTREALRAIADALEIAFRWGGTLEAGEPCPPIDHFAIDDDAIIPARSTGCAIFEDGRITIGVRTRGRDRLDIMRTVFHEISHARHRDRARWYSVREMERLAEQEADRLCRLASV